MKNSIIQLQNQNCAITINLETKSIRGLGTHCDVYFRTYNETTRGVIKATKELTKIFNDTTNIYSIVDFFCNHKIMMTFRMA